MIRIQGISGDAPGELRGGAKFNELVPLEQGAAVYAVTIEPGADVGGWHRHDRGQYLESVSGRGWVQDLGAEAQILEQGERVWCPPGAIHRHGATLDGRWVQFSITPGATEWFADADAAALAATGPLPCSDYNHHHNDRTTGSRSDEAG